MFFLYLFDIAVDGCWAVGFWGDGEKNFINRIMQAKPQERNISYSNVLTARHLIADSECSWMKCRVLSGRA